MHLNSKDGQKVDPSRSAAPGRPLPGAVLTSGGEPYVGMETELGPVVAYSRDPIQSPKTHACHAEQVIAGPSAGRDIRMRIHAAEMEELAAVCRESPQWLAVMPFCSLVVETFVDPSGHRWQLLGLDAEPAKPAGGFLPGLYKDWTPGERSTLGRRYKPPERQRKVHERRIGVRRDQRLYISSRELARWQEFIKGSDGRPFVALDGIGVKLRLHEDLKGWRYVCLSVLHTAPRALGRGA